MKCIDFYLSHLYLEQTCDAASYFSFTESFEKNYNQIKKVATRVILLYGKKRKMFKFSFKQARAQVD